MKAIVVGGTGTVGKAVAEALKEQGAEVVIVGHSGGDFQVDIGSSESIQKMYESIGAIDAVICAPAAKIPVKPFGKMKKEDFQAGLQAKLLGQIDLVIIGVNYINAGGSFTLTSGCLNRDLIPEGSCIATVNNAIEGFVKSAALELPKELRLNAVSPNLLESSKEKYKTYLRGFKPVPDALAAQSYIRSVYGIINGEVLFAR